MDFPRIEEITLTGQDLLDVLQLQEQDPVQIILTVLRLVCVIVLSVVSDHTYSTQAGVCYCVKCCVRSFLQYSGWCVLLC